MPRARMAHDHLRARSWGQGAFKILAKRTQDRSRRQWTNHEFKIPKAYQVLVKSAGCPRTKKTSQDPKFSHIFVAPILHDHIDFRHHPRPTLSRHRSPTPPRALWPPASSRTHGCDRRPRAQPRTKKTTPRLPYPIHRAKLRAAWPTTRLFSPLSKARWSRLLPAIYRRAGGSASRMQSLICSHCTTRRATPT